MTIPSLWAGAFKEAVEKDLAEIAAKGIRLTDLEFPGDDHEFLMLFRKKALLSLGTPSDRSHGTAFADLLHFLYQYEAAFDVPAQSRFILALTCGVCRSLLRVARESYTVLIRTKKIFKGLFDVVEKWKHDGNPCSDDLNLKNSIRGLFQSIIVLSGVVRLHAQRGWFKKILKVFAPSQIEHCISRLEASINHLHQVVRCALEQGYAQQGEPFIEQLHRPDHNKAHGHSYSLVSVSGNAKTVVGDWYDNKKVTITNMVADAGGESKLCTWLRNGPKFEHQEHYLVPETCRWLFGTPKWGTWIQGHVSAPFVVSGPPGSGKSSLAQAALSELRSSSLSPVLSHIFNRASSQFRHAQAFIINVLVQLYAHSRGTPREKAFERLKEYQSLHHTVWDCPYLTLAANFEHILATLPAYFLVIDALDDCAPSQPSISELICKLSLNKGARIIVVCRKTTAVVSPDCQILQLEDYREPIRADVLRFIEHELGSTLQLSVPRQKRLKQQIIDALIQRSQNNFLHTTLLVRLVQQKSTYRQMLKTVMEADHTYAKGLYDDLWRTSERKLFGMPNKIARRDSILKIVVAARAILHVDEIDVLLAIDEDEAVYDETNLTPNMTEEIEELCGSFVSISSSKGVDFFHDTARNFIAARNPTTDDESNLYLALKCLAVLSQAPNNNSRTARKLLQKHLIPSEAPKTDIEEGIFAAIYRYAALHFHEHVVTVSRPPPELVLKLGGFLQRVEFVTWSENVFTYKPGTGFAVQIDVRAALTNWTQFLTPSNQEDIRIQEFFETAHILLSSIFKDEDDQVVQYLQRIRLASFLNEAGQSTSDWQNAYEQKELIYNGVSNILPQNDRFVLLQQASLLQEYFWQKRFPEALRKLQDLYSKQASIIGRAKDDIFPTAWMIAGAFLALGEYDSAESVLTDTIEQVRQVRGNKDRFLNMLLLLEGQRLERVQDLMRAAAIYQAALTAMTEVAGPDNIFVLMLKTALGSIRRKQGRYDIAETLLFEGWAGRRVKSSINVNVCFDEALNLAALYRDKGQAEKTREVLDAIHGSAILQDDFERYCQFIHIQNLVALDEGKYNPAKSAFMEVLHEASDENRSKNNRELLWIRIDLADAMRQHDESDEALMLFSDLVVATDATEMDDEPEPPIQLEPPSQLAAAEKALRLVRSAKFAESQRLLQDNSLRWKREADFYFSIQGGPTLDTSIIAPIKLVDRLERLQ